MQPDSAQAFAQTPMLAGGVPIYLTGEDAVLVTVRNMASAVRVRFSCRFLPVARDGDDQPRVSPQAQDFAPATDRTSSTMVVGLGEGWLIDWKVDASAGAPITGQCYAKVELQRGAGSSATVLSRLARGYVTAFQGPEGPFGRSMDSTDGPGALRSITGTTPGAGAEILETVPAGARWELLAFSAKLVTGAAVANRLPLFNIDDGTNNLYRISGNGTQAASLNFTWAWYAGIATNFTDSFGNLIGPMLLNNKLGAGFRLRTTTGSIQAADQWSTVQYLVREWIEGA